MPERLSANATSARVSATLRPANKYARKTIALFDLDRISTVMEVTCNDSYWLRWFPPGVMRWLALRLPSELRSGQVLRAPRCG